MQDLKKKKKKKKVTRHTNTSKLTRNFLNTRWPHEFYRQKNVTTMVDYLNFYNLYIISTIPVELNFFLVDKVDLVSIILKNLVNAFINLYFLRHNFLAQMSYEIRSYFEVERSWESEYVVDPLAFSCVFDMHSSVWRTKGHRFIPRL